MTTFDDITVATGIELGTKPEEPTWRKSACILCECNCGVEIRSPRAGSSLARSVTTANPAR